MSNLQGTTEWYVEWLAETRPDLSAEVRQEMAEGFAILQEPAAPKVEESPNADTDESKRPLTRAEERRRARLDDKQLASFLRRPVTHKEI